LGKKPASGILGENRQTGYPRRIRPARHRNDQCLDPLAHARGKHVIFVAILDEVTDDFNRKVFVPQIDGAKTSLQLPGIVDEVITLAQLKTEAGEAYRAFICHTVNPWGFPAKDRSGRLDLIEPHISGS